MTKQVRWALYGALVLVAAVVLAVGITTFVNIQNDRGEIARCAVTSC
jgi:hypothetical protein